MEDRRKKHLLAVMYRHAQKNFNIENQHPKIQLRNRGNIKFKVPYTTLTKVQNSPFYRGAKLWERLPEGVQKATTKVKFKTMISLKFHWLIGLLTHERIHIRTIYEHPMDFIIVYSMLYCFTSLFLINVHTLISCHHQRLEEHDCNTYVKSNLKKEKKKQITASETE